MSILMRILDLFLVVFDQDLAQVDRRLKRRTHHSLDRNCHINVKGFGVQLVLPLTCKQSSEVMTMRGHLD